ncbi:MAG: hypothetical protein J6B85_07840 [Lachnospiraceae bacterium]|nr:hypothetical protein [Lachnospiraceae bacterium]
MNTKAKKKADTDSGERTAKTQGKTGLKTWITRGGVMVLFLAIGFAVGYFGGMAIGKMAAESAGGDEKKAILSIVLGLLCIYVGIMLQAAVHEAGHLICGLISGYEFASYRIGNLMFVKKEGKLCLKKYSLAGTGGQCLMTPPRPYCDDIPFLLYNFGGSIANLILAAISLLLYPAVSAPMLRLFFLFLAAAGAALALMNGIPMRSGKLNNDGSNAMALRKNPGARRCFWAQMQMNGELTNEVRIKDMPEEWFEMPDRKARENSICASSAVFCLSRAMDELKFEEAERIGKEILAYPGALVGIHRLMTEAELLYCELLKKCGYWRTESHSEGTAPEAAEPVEMSKELKQFLKSASTLPSALRIQYAYELIENQNEAAAEKCLAAFEKTAARYPHACEIEGERELIACVQEALEER